MQCLPGCWCSPWGSRYCCCCACLWLPLLSLSLQAGLRICCLAAALGLNNSLEALQLTGWSWQELGNGAALPFLALGASSGMLRRCASLNQRT